MVEEESTEEESTEEETPETEALPTAIELSDGDTVTVYYNGMMTRSLPPQATALEVAVVR